MKKFFKKYKVICPTQSTSFYLKSLVLYQMKIKSAYDSIINVFKINNKKKPYLEKKNISCSRKTY